MIHITKVVPRIRKPHAAITVKAKREEDGLALIKSCCGNADVYVRVTGYSTNKRTTYNPRARRFPPTHYGFEVWTDDVPTRVMLEIIRD